MINHWNDDAELDYADRYGISHPRLEKGILRQAYATTLLGADSDLTMHGGGNTSIKASIVDENGCGKRALFVKATGTPLNAFLPEHFVAMDLEYLEGIKSGGALGDEAMARGFREHQLIYSERLPSIETLMHAFIPKKAVDHTHPAAILKIVNRVGGGELLSECFGGDLAVVPYARMGYDLAMAVSAAALDNSGCKGVVMAHHGLIVWGDAAREAYDLTIAIVSKAEEFLSGMISLPIAPAVGAATADSSAKNYGVIAPIVKQCLSQGVAGLPGIDVDASALADGLSLTLLNTPDILDLIASVDGKEIICDPPMTPDYPMYSRIVPLWIDIGMDAGPQKISSHIQAAIGKYASDYRDSLKGRGISGAPALSLLPRAIVHPQAGVVCIGQNADDAQKIADFTRQAFSIRRAIAESGGVYESLSEEYIFDMQYRGYQKT
jgi:rhamnose utilization protein RhaD (predicted bifunctional aldolase and dehydrogenase)